MLLLLVDEEGRLRGSARNARVSEVMGSTYFGHAWLVCTHAQPSDDGNDENLADVGLIYEAIGRGLPTPWTQEDIVEHRARPLKERALELLGLLTLDYDL
jgi:hypothetical protein